MKKISFFTFVFILIFVQNALAHTGLESSFPEDGTVIGEEIETITLTFETKIEQGSSIKLENSFGETLPVENISLAENQLTGNLLNPLKNGDYRVNWSIIGADGHPIDGVISFSVDVPAEVTPAADEGETAVEQTETTEEAQPQTNVEENNQETQQNNSSSYTLPILFGILTVIIAVSIFLMMKRKK